MVLAGYGARRERQHRVAQQVGREPGRLKRTLSIICEFIFSEGKGDEGLVNDKGLVMSVAMGL